jgi:hypothetical protein
MKFLCLSLILTFSLSSQANDQVGIDKALHGTLSMAGTLASIDTLHAIGIPPSFARLTGPLLVGLVGYYKETQDSRIDWEDMGANGIGIGAGFLLSFTRSW